MANTFVSTGVTGTSTTPKVFKKSHIDYAWVNDKCVNPALGHHYICTTAGKASVAKWKYTNTEIIMPPSLSVTNLGAPVRTTVGSGTHFMKAAWKAPNALTDTKKGDRAQNLLIEWTVMRRGSNNDLHVTKTVGTGVTESQINLSGFTVGSRNYTRASFYPIAGGTNNQIYAVSVKVTSKNSWGGKVCATATRNFTKPKAPTISAFSFNSENGHVSATITTDAGAGYAERYDTHYKVTVTDTRTGKTWVSTDATSTATSITAYYDVSDYQQLSFGQYVKITVSAWARGYAGNSDTASRTYYVSYPAQTTIRGVDITSKSSSGRCVARINTNNTTAHPVDGVKLEYLADCEYATASAIPGTATWEDSGAQDDAQCTALTMSVTDLIPEAGNYTWVRVKSYHAAEAVLHRYSNYVRLKALETPEPTATDESVKILSATAGDDGESVIVHLGWNASGTDDATGTELSWSEDADAWKSTEEPSAYEFTWSDGSTTSGGVTYQDSATITIKKLEEGTKYYIRARRYLDGDTTTYSPYSNRATCYTSTAPEAVTATCDRYIPSGQPFPIYWTFAGNSAQEEWQIISTSGKVIASGKGSAGSARISAERLKSVATGGAPIVPTTKSGSVVTFDADEDTVTPSLKAAITPTQAGSGDPSPTNVRAITGWTEAKVFDTGKNLVDESTAIGFNAAVTVDGGYISVTKNGSSNYPAAHINAYLRAGVTYTVSATCVQVTTQTRLAIRDVAPSNTTVTDSASYSEDGQRKSVTYTPTKSGMYRVALFSSFGAADTGTAIFTDIQCEIGSVATAYEPYTGTTTTTALGRTVYGGTVDVVTGVLTVTHKSETFNGTESWGSEQTSGGLTKYYLNLDNASKMTGRQGGLLDDELLCNWLAPSSLIATYSVYVGTTSKYLNCKCSSASDVTSFKSMLTATPLVVVYPLETPQTYNLTTQEVELLAGQNNVWADTGDVTMKYGHKSTGSVNFNVRVSSGSGFVASEEHTVTIVEPPALTITAPSQMTAQPYSFTATCSEVSDLVIIVTSGGAMGQYPDGIKMQTAGDTIYSERVSPEWTASNDEFTTTVTLPTGLDFWDGVTYNMTVTAVDRTTNLRSWEMTATFDVDWTHKAVDPAEFVTVTPVDEVTEDGVRRLAVEIALTPPTDSAETDVYDIYRMDGGTARLIGEGFPLTHTTADEYAPIGEGQRLYYRIALKTVDGDVSFADIEYDLPVNTLRFDWRDGYVELPYNITVGDGYSKSVDIRDHMDGSVDGYWNPNISRKSSLSTDMVTVKQPVEIELVKQLARYAGAVFVRTPNGGAFEADVEVTNLSASNKHIANVAFDATEIGLTPEFILPNPFELEEGE